MTGWARRRFWREVEVVPEGGAWGVRLDGRPVQTPAGMVLAAPTRAFAEAMAEEWRGQGETVEPGTMPATRLANTAIDRLPATLAPVAAMLAAYAESDLLSHRADAPARLVARQRAAWDPVLAWAAEALGASLAAGEGVMPVRQDPEAVARLHGRVAAMPPFRLAAFHDLVTLSGSLLLAFALAEGWLAPEEAWSLSRLDEDFQVEDWGMDEEAAEAAEARRAAFLDAARFWRLLA